MPRGFLFQWTALQRHGLARSEESGPAAGAAPWAPNADVFESVDGIIVRFELAGVPAHKIELSLTERALVLKGIRLDPETPSSSAGYRFRQMEIDYGPFERSVPLPFPIDGDSARAQMRLGILTVYLPRAKESPSKGARIEVKFE